MRNRFYISYRGLRNLSLEEGINKHLGAFGITKAGQWGFNEGVFQCLFLYKKETLLMQFKEAIKRDFPMEYSRLMFFMG